MLLDVKKFDERFKLVVNRFIMSKYIPAFFCITLFICADLQAQMIQKKDPPVVSTEKEKKIVVPVKKKVQPNSVTVNKPIGPLVAQLNYEFVRNPVLGTFADISNMSVAPSLIMTVKSDGTLWGWGYNSLDPYGTAKGLMSDIPVQILSQHRWKKIAIGYDYNFYGIREDGTLWALGKSNSGQLGIGVITDNDYKFPLIQIGKDRGWESLVTGRDFVLALKTDGTLWGWGANKFGQLGNGKYGDTVTAPIQVNSENQWSMISGGPDHMIALKKDGSLWGWGSDYRGVLGINVSNGFFFYYYHKQVGVDKDWVYVSTRSFSSFGIKKDGSMWAWGYNRDNNLGIGPDTSARYAPVRMDNNIKWVKVHTSGEQTIGLDENGRAWVWGFIVGNKPQLVSVDILFKDVYSGGRSFFGIKHDGTLWSWTYDSVNKNVGLGDPVKLSKQPQQIARSLLSFEK